MFIILINNGPKHKSSDAGNSDIPKKSFKVLPISEKAYMHRKKKTVYVGFGIIQGLGIHWRSLNVSPTDKTGLLYKVEPY